MADDQPNKENEVTPKGAVEVSEEDLDQAAGGIIIINSSPADNVSLNYSKIDLSLTGHKGGPAGVVGGPHVAPEKKI